jgi:hypothetical protein
MRSIGRETRIGDGRESGNLFSRRFPGMALGRVGRQKKGGGPPLQGQIGQSKPRTLTWETSGEFGPEFVNGISRSVLKVRGLVVAQFQLAGRKRG